MKYINYLFFFLLAAVTLSSCASTKMSTQQQRYEKELNRIALSSLSIEEKMDGVAMVFDDVLQESMDYTSSRNTLKHINQFQKRNKSTLNTIYDQLEDEMKGMSMAKQIDFSISILRKPYIKTFINIVPKVERKINKKLKQLALFGRFLRIINPL